MSNLFDELKSGNKTILFMLTMFFVFALFDLITHVLGGNFHWKMFSIKISTTFLATALIFAVYNLIVKHKNSAVAQVDKSVLGLVLDNLSTCIYMTEIETGKIIFINKNMRKEFGDKDFIGKVCWEVLQDGFKERCHFCPIYHLKEDPTKPYVWEEHNTVTKKYYQNTDTLLEWIDGSMVHMQHSVDITKRKLIEIEITETLNKLESVMMSYPGIIMSFDESGMHSFSSGYNLEKFNAIKQYFAGNNCADPNFDFEEYSQRIKLAYSGACTHWMMSIAEESYNCFLSPIMNDDDKIIGVLFSANDISATARMQNELQKAIELAEQASKAKSDFLSRMSHEMRTPMNAIMGMSQIAQMADSPEKINYCLDVIDNSSKHLLGLINDILDMSKIEANKLILEKELFNIEKMVMTVCNIVLDKVEEKKQTLNVLLGQNLDYHVIGDELRLSQVLTNLLANAAKFTPKEGKITLSVDRVKTSKNRNTVRFSVSDTGIGISAEQQARLFRSFEQADGSIARKYGGTGLGLAICKNIVEKMGGEIWVKSEENKGSTFAFEVSLDVAPVVSKKTLVGGIKPSDLRVLALIDCPDTKKYFLEIMTKFEIPTDIVSSASEAIEGIEKINRENKAYDVIFFDQYLRGTDGIEAAKLINGAINNSTAIIMISASEWADTESLAKAAGISKFVPKPLFPSSILNSINEVIGQKMQKLDIKTVCNIEKPDFSHLSLLLVEDVQINTFIFKTFLQETNIKIDVAENGLQAVEKFSKSPDKYDIIIMDIQMPEMNGYDATRAIRSLDIENAKTVPIVAMTANALNKDVSMCLECGMNDHLAKPIEKEKIIEKISFYTKKSFPKPSDFLPYIDIADMEKRLKDNTDIYSKLLADLLHDGSVIEFEREFSMGNMKAVKTIVHKIKGISANLSLSEAHKKAQSIEDKIKEGTLQQSDIDEFMQVLTTTGSYVRKFLNLYPDGSPVHEKK